MSTETSKQYAWEETMTVDDIAAQFDVEKGVVIAAVRQGTLQRLRVRPKGAFVIPWHFSREKVENCAHLLTALAADDAFERALEGK